MNQRQEAERRLIELLQKPRERRSLIAQVAREYGMRPGTVKGILFQLIDLRLIKRVGAEHIIIKGAEAT